MSILFDDIGWSVLVAFPCSIIVTCFKTHPVYSYTSALNLCMTGKFSFGFFLSFFFQNDLFRNFLSGVLSECTSGWINIGPGPDLSPNNRRK